MAAQGVFFLVAVLPLRKRQTNHAQPSRTLVPYGSKSYIGSEADMYQREKGKGTILFLGRYNTVFKAELTFILLTTYLALKAGRDRQIHICWDRKSPLQAFEKNRTKSVDEGLL